MLWYNCCMFRFLIYAVIAYFVYQFVMAVDWDSAFSKTSRTAENTANHTYQDVKSSSIVETIEDAFKALRDVIGI